MVQGRWSNHLVLIPLVVLSFFQIFGGHQVSKVVRSVMVESDHYDDTLPHDINGKMEESCLTKNFNLQECPYMAPDLQGNIKDQMNLRIDVPEMEALFNRGSCLAHGGCYKPSHCRSQQKVAILIPYKDREAHLLTLMSYLHPNLQRQGIHYCVFVIEQVDDGRFNKGLIMNAGFLEIMKTGHFDCIVFHDVDMVPEDDKNIYLCRDLPTHLSPLVEKFHYREHYGTDFGGVSMISPDHYIKANGYSNMFWGWGNEDSDMEFRLVNAGIKAVRPVNVDYARYSMIPHEHPWRFQHERQNLGSQTQLSVRGILMLTKDERSAWDGITNVKYRLDHIEYQSMFTKMFVDVRRFLVEELNVVIDGHNIDIEPAPGKCRFLNFEDTYLDPTYSMDRKSFTTGFFEERKAESLCNEKGQSCAGILKNRVSKDGKDWVLREKAIMLSSDDFRFKDRPGGKPAGIRSKMKICQGQMSQVFPLESTVDTPRYKSRVRLNFVLPMGASLLYKDHVLFEGIPTGISHEWPLQIKPNETGAHVNYSFETEEFPLPLYPGWYTVNSKITDRFEQTWHEYNFQFRVSERCRKCGQRSDYISELDAKVKEYVDNKDPKLLSDNLEDIRKSFSHEHDLELPLEVTSET